MDGGVYLLDGFHKEMCYILASYPTNYLTENTYNKYKWYYL